MLFMQNLPGNRNVKDRKVIGSFHSKTGKDYSITLAR